MEDQSAVVSYTLRLQESAQTVCECWDRTVDTTHLMWLKLQQLTFAACAFNGATLVDEACVVLRGRAHRRCMADKRFSCHNTVAAAINARRLRVDSN